MKSESPAGLRRNSHISHTKEAIDHGKQGHPDVLVTHAEAALGPGLITNS